MAFIAISLFACEEKDPVGNGGEPNDKDTTTQVTPDENAMSFSLTYEGKAIKEGDVINVTMDHYAFQELVAHIYLTNNSEKEETFTMKEVRNYDCVTYTSSFCVKDCVPGTTEKEQLWQIGKLASEQEQELAMHLRVGTYESVDDEYVPVFKESATCPGVFTISNGKESITFTLNYVYVKEEVPADEF